MNPPSAATAGASAQAQYGRRRARHDVRTRRSRPRVLLLGGSGVAAGVALMLPGPTWTLLGLVVAGLSVLATFSALVVLPGHVRSWAVGAEGELRTADLLAQLEAQGYRVLHDRRMPGTRANIDHVVVGPTGVFVVETKSWSGPVRIRSGVLSVAGRRSAVIDQVTRQADAIRVALPGVQVRSIVCVHRADLPLRAIELDGVRVVGPGSLLQRLREGPARLGLSEVDRLAADLEARLPRAG